MLLRRKAISLNMIPFSRQELVRAYRGAYNASKVIPRSNAHRLLLFYAAECGLKAIWLRQQSKEILDIPILASDRPVQHDLNKMIDLLRLGKERLLPSEILLPDLKLSGGQFLPRKHSSGELNQAWRYGGNLSAPHSDKIFEAALETLNTWIEKELR